MTLPDSPVDRLRSLLAQGTPGPWWADAGPGGFGTIFVGTSFEARDTWLFDPRDATVEDAALIVAAVNALPLLLDVVEAAKEDIGWDFRATAPSGRERMWAALAALEAQQ